jgi:hypothetical protein
MGPFCKSPGRVLLHIIMVGLLSQVKDKTNMNVVNVVYVVNMDKITEVMDKTIFREHPFVLHPAR